MKTVIRYVGFLLFVFFGMSIYALPTGHIDVNFNRVVVDDKAPILKLTNTSKEDVFGLSYSSVIDRLTCDSQLRAGQSCTFTIYSFDEATQATISSLNSNTINIDISRPASLTEPTLLLRQHLVTPATINYPELQNSGRYDAKISEIFLQMVTGGGVVLESKIPSARCQTITRIPPPGGECFITVDADKSAVGSGIFNFVSNVPNASVRQGIQVKLADLNFYESNADNALPFFEIKPGESRELKIKNNGGAIKKLEVLLSDSLADEIILNTTDCASIDKMCKLKLTAKYAAPRGITGNLVLKAPEINNGEINLPLIITGGISVIPIPKFAASQALARQDVLIKNLSTEPITLANLLVSGAKNIALSANADGKEECKPGMKLLANESCNLSLRAQNNAFLGKQTGQMEVTYSDSSGVLQSKKITVSVATDLYAGGAFTVAGNTPVGYIARWNGKTWSSLANGLFIDRSYPDNSAVKGMAVDTDGNLYVTGGFSGLVHQWNGARWSNEYYPWTNNHGSSIALDRKNNIFAGGDFSCVYYEGPCSIVEWLYGQKKPISVGNMNDAEDIHVVASSPIDDFLVIGGSMLKSKQLRENGVMFLDGDHWSSFNDQLDGVVETVVFNNKNRVYVGGLFVVNGLGFSSNLAKWNGSAWELVGGATVNGRVNAMVFDAAGDLYIGGIFDQINSLGANKIAKWDGSVWSSLNSGIESDGVVYALATDGNNNLYAGGRFNRADNMVVNNIALWNGKGWQPLSSGMAGQVNALVIATELIAKVE